MRFNGVERMARKQISAKSHAETVRTSRVGVMPPPPECMSQRKPPLMARPRLQACVLQPAGNVSPFCRE